MPDSRRACCNSLRRRSPARDRCRDSRWPNGSRSAVPAGRGGRGGGPPPPVALKVVTTNLLEGWLRRNGVPYSDATTLTEYWDRVAFPNGDVWLTVSQYVSDPKYLTAEYTTSMHFKREPDGSKWKPAPCRADLRGEGVTCDACHLFSALALALVAAISASPLVGAGAARRWTAADGGAHRLVGDGQRRGAADSHRSRAGAGQLHRLSAECRGQAEGVDVELDDPGRSRTSVAAARRHVFDARARTEPPHRRDHRSGRRAG